MNVRKFTQKCESEAQSFAVFAGISGLAVIRLQCLPNSHLHKDGKILKVLHKKSLAITSRINNFVDLKEHWVFLDGVDYNSLKRMSFQFQN